MSFLLKWDYFAFQAIPGLSIEEQQKNSFFIKLGTELMNTIKKLGVAQTCKIKRKPLLHTRHRFHIIDYGFSL